MPELKGKKHNILELAYNSLDSRKQILISKLSAFRNPMSYDSVSIFNEYKDQEKFDQALIEFEERGLLLRDVESNKYDLHPIVRKYCYDRLMDEKVVHSQLRDYFATVPKPEKVESVDDLEPVIELYHHTVRSGGYNEAYQLYHNRLSDLLYYNLAAYEKCIELGSALFPEGLHQLPRLERDDSQAYMLNHLAISYSSYGQSMKAVPLFKKQNELSKYTGDYKNLVIGLGNLAYMVQIPLGNFRAAEFNLLKSIRLCREIRSDFWESAGHCEFGRLLAYQGKFEESERELAKSLKFSEEYHYEHEQCVDWTYRALRALFMSDAEEAVKAAQRARELADVERHERDIICAEWLLGAAYLAKGDLKEAEQHLNEALVRDRKINLVEFEPDILLELAKLGFKQGHKEEAVKFAKEALGIADRCEYRLKQADIHNFLTEFYMDAKDFSKAKEHVEIAKERAVCGYKPAMDKVDKLSKQIKEKS